MNIIETKLKGVRIIEPDVFHDDRGIVVKVYHKDTFKKHEMADHFDESFYSISKKDVLRGMHFQTPPEDHAKLVYVSSGAILDVVLDIRKGSPTFGQYVSVELSASNYKMIYIPKGCAHGFLSLENNSYTVYLQETMRVQESEGGIRVDSFGMDWKVANPILSVRDQGFPALDAFKTPFLYEKAR